MTELISCSKVKGLFFTILSPAQRPNTEYDQKNTLRKENNEKSRKSSKAIKTRKYLMKEV